MKAGGFLGAIIKSSRSLGDKPGKVEKTLKSGAPRHDGRSSKRTAANKRMAEAAAELQKVLG
jgi:hypothetical protein